MDIEPTNAEILQVVRDVCAYAERLNAREQLRRRAGEVREAARTLGQLVATLAGC
jgi:hypothetical protein